MRLMMPTSPGISNFRPNRLTRRRGVGGRRGKANDEQQRKVQNRPATTRNPDQRKRKFPRLQAMRRSSKNKQAHRFPSQLAGGKSSKQPRLGIHQSKPLPMPGNPGECPNLKLITSPAQQSQQPQLMFLRFPPREPREPRQIAAQPQKVPPPSHRPQANKMPQRPKQRPKQKLLQQRPKHPPKPGPHPVA